MLRYLCAALKLTESFSLLAFIVAATLSFPLDYAGNFGFTVHINVILLSSTLALSLTEKSLVLTTYTLINGYVDRVLNHSTKHVKIKRESFTRYLN